MFVPPNTVVHRMPLERKQARALARIRPSADDQVFHENIRLIKVKEDIGEAPR